MSFWSRNALDAQSVHFPVLFQLKGSQAMLRALRYGHVHSKQHDAEICFKSMTVIHVKSEMPSLCLGVKPD